MEDANYHLSARDANDIPSPQVTIQTLDQFVPQEGTYPRLCRLSDGSILLGATRFTPDGERILTVTRSTDQGKTFHPHGEVTRSRGDCDNMFLLELSRKVGDAAVPVVLAAFRNHDLDAHGNPIYFRITISQSLDGGRSWKFLSQAYEKPAPFGLWEPFLRLNEHGDTQLYFSQELAADDQDTMQAVSSDRGQTWSRPTAVTGTRERLRDGMVGIADLHDHGGRMTSVMVFETTRYGNFSVECAVSRDDGRTFGNRQLVYMSAGGKRNAGAPQIAAFADGTLVVTFMTDEDSGQMPAWPKHAHVKTVVGSLTKNGAISWSGPYVVSEAGGFWPGIMLVDKYSILVVYENMGSVRGRMVMAKI